MKLKIKAKEDGLAEIWIDKLKVSSIVTQLDLKLKAGEVHKAIIEVYAEDLEVDTECKVILKKLKDGISKKSK